MLVNALPIDLLQMINVTIFIFLVIVKGLRNPDGNSGGMFKNERLKHTFLMTWPIIPVHVPSGLRDPYVPPLASVMMILTERRQEKLPARPAR